MTLPQITGLGKRLVVFMGLFADCFSRRESRMLAHVYVQGQLSDVHRKTLEGIALEFGVAPRTLQRFVETNKWDEEDLHDRCQQIIAKDHGHAEAIGVVDESGVTKSGDDTAGVGRQWNGNRGKLDNCVVGVHLCYATPDFECLLGSGLYLPEDWISDKERRIKAHVPAEVVFRTKPQIALDLIDRRWGTAFAWRLGCRWRRNWGPVPRGQGAVPREPIAAWGAILEFLRTGLDSLNERDRISCCVWSQ